MLSFTSVGQQSSDASQNIQTMRLRDDPPIITQRTSKKRKSPTNNSAEQSQQQPSQTQEQPPQQIQHVLPPPHALMHPLPGSIPPGFQYAPADYTPGGLPPNHAHPHPGIPLQQQSQSPPPSSSNRALSSTKRAEQNRKAQRAFRERRDQSVLTCFLFLCYSILHRHVKALESRSSLLDAALASADEANRRWEECRALVDQLRVENAALRATLSQAHLLPPNLSNSNIGMTHNGTHQEDLKQGEPTDDLKNNAAEAPSDLKQD